MLAYIMTPSTWQIDSPLVAKHRGRARVATCHRAAARTVAWALLEPVSRKAGPTTRIPSCSDKGLP